MMTLPGVPVIYYGDEVGLAGASDPDSRRVLPDVLGGALPARATGAPRRRRRRSAARAAARRRCAAARARRSSPTPTTTSRSQPPPAASARLVVLSRDANAATVDAPGIPAGNYRDAALGRDAHLRRHARRLHRAAARGRHLLPGGHRMPAVARFALLTLVFVAVGRLRQGRDRSAARCRRSNPFNPGDPNSGGYGSGSGGGGAGIPSARRCATRRVRRCAHEFDYGPMTLNGHEKTVTLIGDYRHRLVDQRRSRHASTAASGPSPCRSRGPRAVTYKFHITYDNGAADAYLPDPSNPTQVDDGFGGKNSVFSGTTCDTWTCASTQIACAGTPLSPPARSTGATPSSTGPSSIASSTATPPTTSPSTDSHAHRHRRQLAGRRLDGADRRRSPTATSPISASTRCGSRCPSTTPTSVGQGTLGDTYWYTGYHGYWPRDLTEHRVRTSARRPICRRSSTTAHTAGIKVLIDYAMNHVHQDSPI